MALVTPRMTRRRRSDNWMTRQETTKTPPTKGKGGPYSHFFFPLKKQFGNGNSREHRILKLDRIEFQPIDQLSQVSSLQKIP